MSLILLDGCEDFSSFAVAGGTLTIAAGRNGNAFHGINVQSSSYTIPAAAESDTLTMGVAFRVSAFTNFPSVFNLRSDAGTIVHTMLSVASDGSLRATRQNISNILGQTAAGVIAVNTWYYLEFQAKLHDTTGFVTVRVNGATVINATNVDTKNAGTKTTYDNVQFLNASGSVTDWDDFYLMSGAGDPFLGDIAIETLYPNGNGNVSQWVGSDGDSVNNYLHVDEVGAPVITDYTASSTVGQQDLYTLTDLVGTGTIAAVCHSAYMLRTDTLTPINVKLVNRRAADTKSAAIPLGTAYRSYDYALTADPETGFAWTIANVNALQSGVELA